MINYWFNRSLSILCSEYNIRLVGGTNHCNGRLEIKHLGVWKLAGDDDWNLKSSAVLCRQLDCGSAVSLKSNHVSRYPSWKMISSCNGSESSLRDCVKTESVHNSTSYTFLALEIICSGKTKWHSPSLPLIKLL